MFEYSYELKISGGALVEKNYFITKTGQGECLTTAVLTLPSKNAPAVPKPRLPITMVSASISLAKSIILLAGSLSIAFSKAIFL